MVPLTRRLAWNVGLVMGGRGAGLAINALTLMLVARSLGPERFGTYAVALVFVTLLSSAFDNGANLAVARALTRAPETAPTILGSALVVKALAGLVLTGAAVAIVQAPVFPAELRAVVPIASGLILVTALSVVNAFFQVQLRMGITVAGDIVTRCTFLALALVVLRTGGNVNALFAAQVVASAAGLLLVLWRALRIVRPRFAFDARAWGLITWPALSMAGAFALGQVAARFDVLAMSMFASPRDVGLYSVAFRVVDVVLLLPALLLQVLFPVLVGRFETRPEALEAGYRRVEDLLAFTGIPVAILLAVFASDVLRVAGGPAYVDGGPSLAILAVGMGAVYLSSGMYYLLMAVGRERVQLLWSLVGAAVSASVSLVLVPRWGPVGAATAASLAHASMLAGAAFDLRWRMGISPWPRALPEVIGTSAAIGGLSVAVRASGGGLLLALPLSAAVIGAVLAASPRLRAELRAALVSAPRREDVAG